MLRKHICCLFFDYYFILFLLLSYSGLCFLVVKDRPVSDSKSPRRSGKKTRTDGSKDRRLSRTGVPKAGRCSTRQVVKLRRMVVQWIEQEWCARSLCVRVSATFVYDCNSSYSGHASRSIQGVTRESKDSDQSARVRRKSFMLSWHFCSALCAHACISRRPRN